MDYNNMLVFAASICFIFLFGRIFVKPLKFVCKLALNSVLGGLLILVINYIARCSAINNIAIIYYMR